MEGEQQIRRAKHVEDPNSSLSPSHTLCQLVVQGLRHSSTRRATRSQPRSLLSIARLNMAKSRERCYSCNGAATALGR
jgi:hypothetical protein